MNVSLPLNTRADSWYLANVKHAGFYRVNYDKSNWDALINQLKSNHLLIDVVSRAQLLDDSFNLGRAELVDQTVFLDICRYLEKETDPMPFTPAFSGLGFISNLLSTSDNTYELFKASLFLCC